MNKTHTPDSKPYKRISLEMWAEMEMAYALGRYTLKEICDKYKMKAVTVQKHMAIKNVKFGSKAPELQASVQQRNLALFAKLGTYPEHIAEKLKEGLDAEIVIMTSKNGEIKAEKSPDYRVRLQYAQEIAKLTGSYPIEKKEDSGDKHLHLHFDAEKAKSMSPQDIYRDYVKAIEA